jgi:tetratricopeptide (TPR) repeat protein
MLHLLDDNTSAPRRLPPAVFAAPVLRFFLRFPRSLMAIPIHTRRWLTLIFAVVLFAGVVAAHAQAPAQQPPADFDSLAHAAAAARDAGQKSEAVDLYRRALALRPDWAEGWWYVGTILYDADQFREALPAFRKVHQLAPQAPGVMSFLGLCEFETGDYDSAQKHLEASHGSEESQQDPQLARVVSYHLALLVNRAGESRRALEILTRDFSQGQPPNPVIFAMGLCTLHIPLLPGEVDPSREAFLQSVGRLAVQTAQGSAAQTVEAYRALVQQNPEVPYLRIAFANALRAASQDSAAADEEKQEPATKSSNPEATRSATLALFKNSGTPVAASNSQRGKGSSSEPGEASQQAITLFAAGRYADSIAPLKSWVATSPQDGTAWTMLGLAEFETLDYDNAFVHLEKGSSLGFSASLEAVRFAHYRLAELLIRDGQFTRASALLVPGAEGNPLSPQIQFALGLALLHMNRFPEEVDPQDRDLVRAAGHVSLLLHQSKYTDAFPELDKLLEKYPHTAQLHYAYGVGLAALSRYDEALAQFAAESRISANSELPWVQRAFIELQTKKPAEALASAQKAVELSGKSAEAHYVLGRALFESGKFQEAEQELQTAARLNPGSPEVHFNLAKVYAKLNRAEDAQRERELFTQLNEQIEKQRSRDSNQSYGAAHSASELSRTQPQQQPPPQK